MKNHVVHLDPEIKALAKAKADDLGISLKEFVSDLIRKGVPAKYKLKAVRS